MYKTILLYLFFLISFNSFASFEKCLNFVNASVKQFRLCNLEARALSQANGEDTIRNAQIDFAFCRQASYLMCTDIVLDATIEPVRKATVYAERAHEQALLCAVETELIMNAQTPDQSMVAMEQFIKCESGFINNFYEIVNLDY